MTKIKNKKSINNSFTFISIYSDLTSSFHRPLVRKELNRKLKSPTKLFLFLSYSCKQERTQFRKQRLFCAIHTNYNKYMTAQIA